MQDGTSSLDVFWPATTIIIIITIIINLLLLLLNLYRPPSICPSFQFHFNFIPFSLQFFNILILKSRSFDIIDVIVIITIKLLLLLLNLTRRPSICPPFHFHCNFFYILILKSHLFEMIDVTRLHVNTLEFSVGFFFKLIHQRLSISGQSCALVNWLRLRWLHRNINTKYLWKLQRIWKLSHVVFRSVS